MIVKYAYYVRKTLLILLLVHSVQKSFRKYNINLSQHRHFTLMPTIATMFNSRLPPHSMAGYTTKTVQGSYCFFGFPTNGQAKELPMPHGNASGGTPRELPSSLPTQGRLPPSRVVNLRYSTPGPLGPLAEDPLHQHHTVVNIL